MAKQITVVLSDSDFEKLHDYVKKGCLNRTAFIEKLIMDFIAKNPIKEVEAQNA